MLLLDDFFRKMIHTEKAGMKFEYWLRIWLIWLNCPWQTYESCFEVEFLLIE
jgi:hypothetical protein